MTDNEKPKPNIRPFDLQQYPPFLILSTHLSEAELHSCEDALVNAGATLTYDPAEAGLVLGKIGSPRRAKLELAWKGLHLTESAMVQADPEESSQPSPKKARRDSALASEPVHGDPKEDEGPKSRLEDISGVPSDNSTTSDLPWMKNLASEGQISVIKLDWLYQSFQTGELASIRSYLLLQGKPEFNAQPNLRTRRDSGAQTSKPQQDDMLNMSPVAEAIVKRAKADYKPQREFWRRGDRIKNAADQDFAGKSFTRSKEKALSTNAHKGHPAHLLRESTSDDDEDTHTILPLTPAWVKENRLYACQRSTPPNPPNSDFIEQLKEIRVARLLMQDEIGVRAYSTTIASLAAYPYRLQSVKEVLMLPGCDQKIAHLFKEFKANDGHVQAVIDVRENHTLKVLREFYEIWGVGATTAREFFYHKGWRDLDDIIEYGWGGLNRVQQIGLKYNDEFHIPIPRTEVESIANIIDVHAKRVTNENAQTVIVGGYRRGKIESGDVDVILSHPQQEMTGDLVTKIVISLEKEGWITHTLTLNLTNSKRQQEPVALKPSEKAGHGFDTLDKALVVWQDPQWPNKVESSSTDLGAKNPNPHRRVDIIISPWRTVGCAIAGWTSGTTFQRDLRRYTRKKKGWKFDSSGVRNRITGAWIDLERWTDPATRCTNWQEAERRVFEGLGLEYREPWERCTD